MVDRKVGTFTYYKIYLLFYFYFNRIRDEITANNTNNEVANYIQSLYTQSEAICISRECTCPYIQYHVDIYTNSTYRFIHKYLSTMLLFHIAATCYCVHVLSFDTYLVSNFCYKNIKVKYSI